ncbi:MNIO family bufferin maturase [Luteibacter yeojuensis]|uniref:Uncharacterized protein n=1 Tax=Luteibacter yeojuensis TaxID=345309 RepID=A0A0F3KXZ7_9GAMM|nr:DUF692 domain-containing protein [Luteibacter yeojuensis]KJV36078.1 hypothetical protein VI08_06255 [Luteibacter yeojuensis]
MAAPGIGLGFKPAHAEAALGQAVPGLWLEIHPENYMVDGGPRLALLDALAGAYPLSLHGVSLSLAADEPPDAAHLARLRAMVDRVQPVLVSEHLAWSTRRGTYLPDLLPFPRSHAALQRVADNIGRTQDALGITIAVENPTHYMPIDGHDYSEGEFFAELVRRTGCGLLLDVNNIHVSAHNLGTDARAWLGSLPLHAVREVHLAGHATDATGLLVDSHDAPVAAPVWALFADLLRLTGPRPTLLERDGNVPAFGELLAEREHALAISAAAA